MNKKFAITTLTMVALVATLIVISFASQNKGEVSTSNLTLSDNTKEETAIFAGGCFWCVESDFEKVEGVSSVVSGYTGGHVENPTYKEVCSHTTGHLEAVKVTYDANQVTYNDLLEVFWRKIDPTDADGQFVDRGEPYGPAIFVANDEQRKLAEMSIQRLQESGRFDKEIVTPVRDAVTFYDAEDYHQDYYQKNYRDYSSYRKGSGRDQFIEKVWGADKDYQIVGPAKSDMDSKSMGAALTWTDQRNEAYVQPSDEELQQRLTELQFRVTRHEGTERPFSDGFWDNKEEGIYVDIVSGEPLFSSKDKFRSGTGWPSFTRPLVEANIEERVDRSLLSTRTEVRSKHADSHLGHVFSDGPAPTGLRYCINSASLRFVPTEELEKQGYKHFAK